MQGRKLRPFRGHGRRATEAYLWQQGAFGGLSSPHSDPSPSAVEDALARSAAQLSRDLWARTILVISRSGRTAAVMSSSRPAAPIVATSPQASTCRIATLLWGVIPVVVEPNELDDPLALARSLARELGFGVEGQKLLLVRGFGNDPSRDAPSVAVVTI